MSDRRAPRLPRVRLAKCCRAVLSGHRHSLSAADGWQPLLELTAFVLRWTKHHFAFVPAVLSVNSFSSTGLNALGKAHEGCIGLQAVCWMFSMATLPAGHDTL